MASRKIRPHAIEAPEATCHVCGRRIVNPTDQDLMFHVATEHPAELLMSGAKKLLAREDLLGALQTMGAAAARAIFKGW